MKRRTIINVSLACAAFLVATIATFLSLREPMEPLTAEGLSAARARWKASRIADYDISFRLNGSLCDIEVRGGIVVGATVDARTPTSADLGAYSVDGLFDVLALESENRDDPAGPFAGRGANMVMRVRFNAELGYVERYLRSSSGAGRGASIELVRFERISGS